MVDYAKVKAYGSASENTFQIWIQLGATEGTWMSYGAVGGANGQPLVIGVIILGGVTLDTYRRRLSLSDVVHRLRGGPPPSTAAPSSATGGDPELAVHGGRSGSVESGGHPQQHDTN